MESLSYVELISGLFPPSLDFSSASHTTHSSHGNSFPSTFHEISTPTPTIVKHFIRTAHRTRNFVHWKFNVSTTDDPFPIPPIWLSKSLHELLRAHPPRCYCGASRLLSSPPFTDPDHPHLDRQHLPVLVGPHAPSPSRDFTSPTLPTHPARLT